MNDTPAHVKADTQDAWLVTEPDAEPVAAMSAYTTARSAHHEAGHAVAAVFRGGELLAVHLGHVDWSTFDTSADRPGETHHRTRADVQPFVTFAGRLVRAVVRSSMSQSVATASMIVDLGLDGATGTGQMVSSINAQAAASGLESVERSVAKTYAEGRHTLTPVGHTSTGTTTYNNLSTEVIIWG